MAGTAIKVYGPYRSGRGWRLVFFDPETGEKRFRRFASREEAEEAVDASAALNPTQATTVRWALEQYEVYGRSKELRAGSLDTYRSALASFHGPLLDRRTHVVTASMLDRRIAERRAAGKAVDTVASELRIAKTFWRWAGKKGWVGAKLLAELPELKVEGKRRRGKPQLTADEARRFLAVALAEPDEDVAVAVSAPLLMGIDGKEIFCRKVRDLDEGGTVLWVRDGKTDNRNRRCEIPEALQPLFAELAEGKAGDDWLFGSDTSASGHRGQTWCQQHTERVRKLAKVPRVTPHGLRGTHGTLAHRAGATAHQVSASLGHGGVTVTRRHYLAPGVEAEVQQHRVLRVLEGGKRVAKNEKVATG